MPEYARLLVRGWIVCMRAVHVLCTAGLGTVERSFGRVGFGG